jgi:hypothetical protein
MKLIWTIVVILLALLAIASGVSKVMLMPQEIAFFGAYGFSATVLVGFGVFQVIGGAMLPFSKTQFYGAAITAATFLVSLVLLVLTGNTIMSVITAAVSALLIVVMVRSRRADAVE